MRLLRVALYIALIVYWGHALITVVGGGTLNPFTVGAACFITMLDFVGYLTEEVQDERK